MPSTFIEKHIKRQSYSNNNRYWNANKQWKNYPQEINPKMEGNKTQPFTYAHGDETNWKMQKIENLLEYQCCIC